MDTREGFHCLHWGWGKTIWIRTFLSYLDRTSRHFGHTNLNTSEQSAFVYTHGKLNANCIIYQVIILSTTDKMFALTKILFYLVRLQGVTETIRHILIIELIRNGLLRKKCIFHSYQKKVITDSHKSKFICLLNLKNVF